MLYRGNSIEGSNPSLSVFKKPAFGPAFYWSLPIALSRFSSKTMEVENQPHCSVEMLTRRSTEAAAHVILSCLLGWSVEDGFGTVVLHQVTDLA